jgi:hypothetical protein
MYSDDSDGTTHGSSIYQLTTSGVESGDLASAENAVQNEIPSEDEEEGVRFTDDSEENDVVTAGDGENGLDVIMNNAEQDESGLTILDDEIYAELAETAADPKTLHWRITDNIPQITLGKGTVVSVGIILDQIYDKDAVGVLSIGAPETASAEITGSTDGKLAANNGDQVKVPSVNQTGGFKLTGLKTLSVGTTYSLGSSLFSDTSGTVLSDDQYIMLCSDGSSPVIKSNYVQVNGYNEKTDTNGNPAPSVAIKVTKGMQLKITALSVSDSETRPLDIVDASVNSVISGSDVKPSYEVKTETEDGTSTTTLVVDDTDTTLTGRKVVDNAGLSAMWFGAESTRTVTVNADGIVYIISRNSNIKIESIEVVSNGSTGE